MHAILGTCGAASLAIAGSLAAESPQPTALASRPALVELGRRLFFDPAIGREGRIGCASCHDPEHDFSDPRPVSQDETRALPRHSQPLVDLAGEGFHWDGEFDSVREVIDARILPGSQPLAAVASRVHRRVNQVVSSGGHVDPAAAEHLREQFAAGGPYGEATGRCDMPEEVSDRQTAPSRSVASRIAIGGRYDAGFRQAFGDAGVTSARVGDALEAYLGSIRSTASDYDRFAAGDVAALSESARRGLELFRGRANCSQCHVLDGTRAPFTDGKFHNTGVASQHQQQQTRGPADDLGRLGTQLVAGRGAFKTPSLRDVARRGPWFHDASAASLEQAVRYYDKGGTANPDLDARLHPLGLSDGEVADLVAFLGSLTSAERPGLGAADDRRSRSIAVRIEDLDGVGVAGRAVTIEPRGDRLAGTSAMPESATVFTDENGDAIPEMPASTHFVVKTTCTEPSAMLPDWTTSARFIVVPANKVAVRVRFRPECSGRPESFVAHVGDLFSAGEPIHFVKVRDLGAESIYAAAAPRKELAPAACVLVGLPIAAGSKAAYVLDLRGGVDNTIDLTVPLGSDVDDAAIRAAARREVDQALRVARAARPPKK